MDDTPIRALSLPDVIAKTKLSKSTIYGDATFPRPCRFGGASRWIEHEVDAWLRQRIAERDQPDAGRHAKAMKAAQRSVESRATSRAAKSAAQTAKPVSTKLRRTKSVAAKEAA